MTVFTRWHKLRDAMPGPRLCLASTPEAAKPASELPPSLFDPGLFAETLDAFERSPRFIVPEALARMSITTQAMQSLSDMYDCGVVSLPYPSCVVEFDAGDTRYHVHLTELPEDEATDGLRWHALPVASYPEDGHETPMAFPCGIRFGLRVESEGEEGANVRFAYRADVPGYIPDSDGAMPLVEAVAPLVFRRSAVAFLSALLLPNTIGLAREPVSVKPSLNRTRVAKGRRPIPDHTVIRLVSYAMPGGAERRYDDRTPVEVHLRRTHKRRVAFGVGRTGRRWTLIPARVIGYLPDGRKPSVAELLATRAARPYVVRVPEPA